MMDTDEVRREHRIKLVRPARHKPGSPYREVYCTCGAKLAGPTLAASERVRVLNRHIEERRLWDRAYEEARNHGVLTDETGGR